MFHPVSVINSFVLELAFSQSTHGPSNNKYIFKETAVFDIFNALFLDSLAGITLGCFVVLSF